MAGLEFHITAENRDFINKVRQMQDAMKEASSKIESEGDAIDGVLRKIGQAAAAMGVGFSAQKLISDIVRVRGEFQQLEIAMETMLGSQEKATALMTQLTQTAAKTPFGLTDIAQGAKQLLAYGTASENVNETLVRLGNIASGLSIPLNDLVYLYGTTMTQGRLFTQDLRQFMGRGIPLADELAKQFKVDKSAVGELVTAGKVGFPEVQKAIEAMTNEGGKFFNLMEKQSSSLTGQISNLEDAWDMMLNEIGTKTQGVASAAIQGVSSLIENYERVGKVVMDIAVAYGSYKAATVAVSLVQKINTLVMEEASVQIALAAAQHHNLSLAQAKSAASTVILTRAKQKLIGVMKGVGKALTNPYVLATAAVAGLAFGVYKLITYQTDAEKAQKRLNKAFGEAAASAGAEIRELDILKGRLAAAKKGSVEYQEIKDEIVSKYGKYDENLDAEITKVGDLTTVYDNLTTAIQNATNARMYEKYVSDEQETYDKDVSTKLEKIQNILYGKEGIDDSTASKVYSKIWKHIFQGEELDAETEAIIDKFNHVWSTVDDEGGSVELISNKVRKLIGDVQKLNKEYDSYIDNARERFGQGALESDFMKGVKKLDKQQLEDLKEQLDEGLEKFKETGQGQSFSLVSGEQITLATEQEIKDAIGSVNAFLAKLKPKPTDPEPVDEDAIKQAKKAEKKVDEKASKALFELKKAQTEDEIKLIELEKERKIEALKEELEAYRAIYEAAGMDTAALEKNFATLIEVEEKMAAIDIAKVTKEKDSERKAKEAEEKKAAEDHVQDLLETYRSYEDEKLALTQSYNMDTAVLLNKYLQTGDEQYMRSIEERRKAYVKALNRLEKEMGGSDYQLVFGDPSKMTSETISKALNVAKKMLKEMDEEADPEFYQALVEAIDGLESARDMNPFEGWDTSVMGLIQKLYQIKKIREDITDAESRGDEEAIEKYNANLESSKKDLRNALIGTGADAFANSLSQAADAMAKVAEISGDVQLTEAAEQLGAFSQNLSAAAQGASSGGWIGAIVGGVTDLISQTVQAFTEAKIQAAEAAKNASDYRRQIEMLKYVIDEADFTSVFGVDEMAKSVDALEKASLAAADYEAMMEELSSNTLTTLYEKQKQSNSIGAAIFSGSWGSLRKVVSNEFKGALEAYRKGYSQLEAMQVKTADYSGFANFFGKKDEYTALKDLAPDLWGADGVFSVENAKEFLDTNTQLNEEQREQIQNIIDMKDAYDEANKVIDDYLESLYGSWGTDLSEAISDAVLSGADAWDVFDDKASEVIKNIGKQMIYNAFFKDIMDSYNDSLRSAVGDPEAMALVTGQLVESLKNTYTAATDATKQFYDYAKDVAGIDVYEDSEARESYKKSGITASQDSVDRVDARLTTMQGHTYTISEECRKTSAYSSQMLMRLTAIEKNTSYLAAISQDLASMSSDINDIKNKGVVML